MKLHQPSIKEHLQTVNKEISLNNGLSWPLVGFVPNPLSRCGLRPVMRDGGHSLQGRRRLRGHFQRAHLAMGYSQNFLHLRVPESPVVFAWKLSELVRDFSFEKNRRQLTIGRQKSVFRPAIEIEEGKRRDTLCWQLSKEFVQVV